MSKLSEFLTNIANAIRNLKGTSEPINAQNFANEINDIKEALDDTNATPEDIKLGKTAFIKGQKVEGTYKTPTSLKALLDYTKSSSYMFRDNMKILDLTGYIDYEDTSNVTNMEMMFHNCSNLITIPKLDTRNASNMYMMVYNCNNLITVSQLDMRKATSTIEMFSYCYNLTNLTLLNLKRNLQVGSGSTWGHLLTLESLLGLCQECVNVNSSRTLTVGSANLEKLANVYVKLTNEPEEDETLPKIPMVQCESTDEGAMLIQNYMKLKNWTLQ